jgi:hypothetical protein
VARVTPSRVSPFSNAEERVTFAVVAATTEACICKPSATDQHIALLLLQVLLLDLHQELLHQ